MPNKSHIPSDAESPAYVQHWTDPRWIFPRHAVQILSVERLLLPPMPWCLLFCVKNRIISLLLTGWSVITVIATKVSMQCITVNKSFRQLEEPLRSQVFVLMGDFTTPISAGRTTQQGTSNLGGS